jgi:hypothetical protein
MHSSLSTLLQKEALPNYQQRAAIEERLKASKVIEEDHNAMHEEIR